MREKQSVQAIRRGVRVMKWALLSIAVKLPKGESLDDKENT